MFQRVVHGVRAQGRTAVVGACALELAAVRPESSAISRSKVLVGGCHAAACR